MLEKYEEEKEVKVRAEKKRKENISYHQLLY